MRKLWTLSAVLATALTMGVASGLAIVGGSDDRGAHPYVGAALQFFADGTQLCSGSLISPRIFVTAAHCFPDGSQAVVTFEEDIFSASSFYTGTGHVHPDWCFACGNGLDTHEVGAIKRQGFLDDCGTD